jgi:hypothetical protein
MVTIKTALAAVAVRWRHRLASKAISRGPRLCRDGGRPERRARCLETDHI